MSSLVGTKGSFIFEFGNRPDVTVKFLFCVFVKKLKAYRVRLSIGYKHRDSRETYCHGSVMLASLRRKAAELADEYAARQRQE